MSPTCRPAPAATLAGVISEILAPARSDSVLIPRLAHVIGPRSLVVVAAEFLALVSIVYCTDLAGSGDAGGVVTGARIDADEAGATYPGGAASNSATSLTEPLDVLTFRAQGLYPFFVIFTACCPSARARDDGVFPTKLPSISMSAFGGEEEISSSVDASLRGAGEPCPEG